MRLGPHRRHFEAAYTADGYEITPRPAELCETAYAAINTSMPRPTDTSISETAYAAEIKPILSWLQATKQPLRPIESSKNSYFETTHPVEGLMVLQPLTSKSNPALRAGFGRVRTEAVRPCYTSRSC